MKSMIPVWRRSAGMAFLMFIILLVSNKALAQNAGTAYFQQRNDYLIDVTLDDVRHMLYGTVKISYTNNSPDTLSYIFLHLYPNAYKEETSALSRQLVENGRTRLFYADDEDRGFIDSLSIHIDGKYVTLEEEYNGYVDIGRIRLPEPLLPGNSTVIETPFRVKVPDAEFSRLGHTGQAYFITQWYPRPAVYDKHGWNEMPYLDQGEFYGDFGRFDVTITLPANYVVGATGKLNTASEIEWLINRSGKSDTSLVRTKGKSKEIPFPESSLQTKTLYFSQDSVHDFAWFADKRYNILIDTIRFEDQREIISYTLYTPQKAEIWETGPEIIEQSIRYLENEVGKYPYDHITIVDGTIMAGGGMEYPLITVLNSPSNEKEFKRFVFHEICHNWFQGMLASNERKYAWMDEGITSYYESEFDRKFILNNSENNGNEDASFIAKYSNPEWIRKASVKYMTFNNSDQPASTAADEFTYIGYGIVNYASVPLALSFLNDYLGDSVYKYCMHNYFDQWKFRHPEPSDMRSVFEKESGKNLSWFFDGLLSTTSGAEVKAISGRRDDSVTIKHKSGVNIPVKVEDSSGNYVWSEPVTGTATVTLSSKDKKFYMNKGYSELLKTNSGPFKKGGATGSFKKLNFGIVPHVYDQPGTERITVLPIAAWNRYNDWMTGLWVTNMNWIPEKFEFNAAPLYDFGRGKFYGAFNAGYNIWPVSGLFSGVHVNIFGKSFAYQNAEPEFGDPDDFYSYSKIEPSVRFEFRKRNPRSTARHSIGYSYTNLWLDEVQYALTDSVYVRVHETNQLYFNTAYYEVNNRRNIDPYQFRLTFEGGESYSKLFAELNYKFSYKKHGKGLEVRLFGGVFLTDNELVRDYRFRMSGWAGYQDYKFDETYFGRTDDHGLWSQQFMVKDGGFRMPTYLGQTNKWLAAMNVNVDLPVPLPVALFADIGSYERISDIFEDLNNRIMFDAGIAVRPFKKILEVYFPVFYSDDINKNIDSLGYSYWDTVRFVFNINELSPRKARNNIIESFQ